MTPGATVGVWAVLAAMVGGEVLLSYAGAGFLAPLAGMAMAVLVALTFMRLGSSKGLVPVFAVAGLFWLCVMMGLGSLDSFTRHDLPVAARTQPD